MPFLFALPASAEVKYVTPDGSGDGVSWASAMGLEKFIDEVKGDGNEFRLAEGDYVLIETLEPGDGVTIKGGYSGTGNERDPAAYETKLNGGGVIPVMKVAENNTVTLDGLTITRGLAGHFGGGIFCDEGGNATAINCAFTGNRSIDAGGAVAAVNLTPSKFSPEFTARNCTFEGNTASAAGAVYVWEGEFTAEGCTFVNNSASQVGAVSVVGDMIGVFNATNCTFTGNESTGGYGGALRLGYKFDATITNCTFKDNKSGEEMKGHSVSFTEPEPGAAFNAINTIFWGTNHDQFYNGDGLPDTFSLSHCIVQGGFPGDTNVINRDPLLDDLADNGGPTKTMALREGSPAIDAGTAEGAPATDQRGVARPRGNAFDIGAFERNQGGTPGGSGGCSALASSPSALLLLAPLAALAWKRGQR
ncbi:MAG: choice-of-anchor Q domain-containing protein [Aminivibrio sp.]